MTYDADFKRLVRQRMRDTGESYLEARTSLRNDSTEHPATLPEPLTGRTDTPAKLEFGWDPTERKGFVGKLTARPTVQLHDGVIDVRVGELFRLAIPRELVTAAYRVADLPADAPLGIRGKDRRWFAGERRDNLVTLELSQSVRADIDLEVAAATDGSGPRARFVGWAVGLLARYSKQLFQVQQLTLALDDPDALLVELQAFVG